MELPYDVVTYLTQFMNERDLLNFSKAQTVYNFEELAMKRLEMQLEKLTLMTITSEVREGRQTLTHSVLGLKKRNDNEFDFTVKETPIMTHFDNSYMKKSHDKHTTVWFGSSRHTVGDKGIQVFLKDNLISIKHDLLLTSIGQ